MRSSLFVIAVLIGSACFRAESAPAKPAKVTKAAASTLRIKRVTPRIGSVRVETTFSHGASEDSRTATRVVILGAEGHAATKIKISYLEMTGAKAALEGKSYVVSMGDGPLEVTPVDGTPPGDEDAVRADNDDLGQVDSTVLMFTDRDFEVGKAVTVPNPPSLPKDAVTTVTLRSFDASSAVFDMKIDLASDTLNIKARGSMTIERATGRERRASMEMESGGGRRPRKTSVVLEATTE